MSGYYQLTHTALMAKWCPYILCAVMLSILLLFAHVSEAEEHKIAVALVDLQVRQNYESGANTTTMSETLQCNQSTINNTIWTQVDAWLNYTSYGLERLGRSDNVSVAQMYGPYTPILDVYYAEDDVTIINCTLGDVLYVVSSDITQEALTDGIPPPLANLDQIIFVLPTWVIDNCMMQSSVAYSPVPFNAGEAKWTVVADCGIPLLFADVISRSIANMTAGDFSCPCNAYPEDECIAPADGSMTLFVPTVGGTMNLAPPGCLSDGDWSDATGGYNRTNPPAYLDRTLHAPNRFEAGWLDVNTHIIFLPENYTEHNFEAVFNLTDLDVSPSVATNGTYAVAVYNSFEGSWIYFSCRSETSPNSTFDGDLFHFDDGYFPVGDYIIQGHLVDEVNYSYGTVSEGGRTYLLGNVPPAGNMVVSVAENVQMTLDRLEEFGNNTCTFKIRFSFYRDVKAIINKALVELVTSNTSTPLTERVTEVWMATIDDLSNKTYIIMDTDDVVMESLSSGGIVMNCTIDVIFEDSPSLLVNASTASESSIEHKYWKLRRQFIADGAIRMISTSLDSTPVRIGGGKVDQTFTVEFEEVYNYTRCIVSQTPHDWTVVQDAYAINYTLSGSYLFTNSVDAYIVCNISNTDITQFMLASAMANSSSDPDLYQSFLARQDQVVTVCNTYLYWMSFGSENESFVNVLDVLARDNNGADVTTVYDMQLSGDPVDYLDTSKLGRYELISQFAFLPSQGADAGVTMNFTRRLGNVTFDAVKIHCVSHLNRMRGPSAKTLLIVPVELHYSNGTIVQPSPECSGPSASLNGIKQQIVDVYTNQSYGYLGFNSSHTISVVNVPVNFTDVQDSGVEGGGEQSCGFTKWISLAMSTLIDMTVIQVNQMGFNKLATPPLFGLTVPSFDHIVFIFPDGISGCSPRYGSVVGQQIGYIIGCGNYTPVVSGVHVIGHQMGLAHALDTSYASGDISDYMGLVMSEGDQDASQLEFSGPERLGAGWLLPPTVYHETLMNLLFFEPVTVELVHLSVSPPTTTVAADQKKTFYMATFDPDLTLMAENDIVYCSCVSSPSKVVLHSFADGGFLTFERNSSSIVTKVAEITNVGDVYGHNITLSNHTLYVKFVARISNDNGTAPDSCYIAFALDDPTILNNVTFGTTGVATTGAVTTASVTTGVATTAPATTSPATTAPATTSPATTAPLTTGIVTTSVVSTSLITTGSSSTTASTTTTTTTTTTTGTTTAEPAPTLPDFQLRDTSARDKTFLIVTLGVSTSVGLVVVATILYCRASGHRAYARMTARYRAYESEWDADPRDLENDSFYEDDDDNGDSYRSGSDRGESSTRFGNMNINNRHSSAPRSQMSVEMQPPTPSSTVRTNIRLVNPGLAKND